MKVLIIEPHGDDAVLSAFDICKSYIKGGISKLDIVTLASTRSSQGLVDKGYASSSKFYEIPHSVFQERPTKPIEVNRLYKIGENIDDYFSNLCLDLYKSQYDKIDSVVRSLKDYNYDVVVTVVGVSHVDHILTRLSVMNHFDKSRLILVSDVPYSSKVYGKKLLDSALNNLGLNIDSMVYGKKMEEDKISCFTEVYPTERMMLRWDKDNITKPCEYFCFSEYTKDFMNKIIKESE